MKCPLCLIAIFTLLLLRASGDVLPAGIASWEWLREDPAGWRSHDGVLELRAQKGRIWAGDGAKNLLIDPQVAAGRTIAVDVAHGAPEAKYEQGGLLAYRDDDHFVKLIVEFIDGEYFIVLAREVAGKGQVISKTKIADKAARMRLAVSGNRLTASFATRGGGDFSPAGECELPGASRAHFALFTQDGSDEGLRWIRFENISSRGGRAGGGAFDTRQLCDEFHAEGAAFGDINKDGSNDIVYGPFWFQGPDFEIRHLIYKPNRFAIATYSNNFMPHIDDLDGDGWEDVLVLGFPGRERSTYWYRNPGAGGGDWEQHVVFGGPGNESPAWADVDGDGKKEIVCSIGGQFVLVRPDWAKPEEPWEMQPISPPGSTGGHFTHGMGLGDVDGDGLVDLLEKSGWWQQGKAGELWEKHEYPFSEAGGAQMFACDLDGDGDSDVITSLAAHGFGLAWFEQVEGDGGSIGFKRHLIMGSRPEDSAYGIAFSGLHGMDLADVDGDGISDLITGTRYFAHNGNDPGDKLDPVIYWFRTIPSARPGEVEFVPHLITPDTGVGTVVNSGDIDGDGRLDILIGNKKGCFVHLQNDKEGQPLAKVERVRRDKLEGESLQVLKKSGNPRPQNMAGFGAGVWSGDAQLWWTGGKLGDVLELAIPVGVDGIYQVSAAMSKAVDYGIFQLSIDGQPLGAPIDFFQAVGVGHTGELQLGTLELGEGEHAFAAKILGAHPDAAEGYMFGLDFLHLKLIDAKPQAIFDGKTLDGWDGDKQRWHVEDGAITTSIPAGESLASNQFLYWDGELHDFELRLRYRITGHESANSGVQIRSRRMPDGHAIGYQADLDHGLTWAGHIYDEHGRGLIGERGTRVTITPAGGREVQRFREAAELAAVVRREEWNDYTIRAVGPRIQTWINGELFADLTDNQIGQQDFSGKLAVQIHSGPGPAKVEFKDLMLTDLGRTEAPAVISDPNGTRPGISPPGKNLGFEDGTLGGWEATGNVWEGSPVEGDTVSLRRPGQASRHDGKFWVGGYERTHRDDAQGTLTSGPFAVTHPWASLLVGGGAEETTRVEIISAGEGGEVLFAASGKEAEDMEPAYVDLAGQVGKMVRVRVIDESSGPWGHINYDDFRFHSTKPIDRPARVATNPLLQHLTPNPAAEGADPTIAGMWVPEGFQVELVAKEPVVTQPIAFTFDERGRIWVAEAHSYPRRQPEGEGKDRIIILEDTDGDGSFEKKTTFATGLNLVSGLEVGFGGVWVGAAPQFLFIPDKDRDDVPDGDPVVLLDGWGLGDTHETLNSFTWGPDGWLYGNQGVFNHSKIGRPGTAEGDRTEMRAGVWRYHPQRHEFEIFATGCSNQWGIDFDEMGHLFITHCRSAWGGGPTSYVVKGGHYWNQSNSNHAPFISGGAAGWNPGKEEVFRNYLLSSARYGHGEGGAGIPGTRALYGGHAHVGTMIYLGSNWPDRYRNQLFTHNLHGHQMNVQVNEREGSGFNTVHAGADQLYTPDPRFIGVDLKYGPDGAVYMIDWRDKQHCHTNNVDAWDRSDGRIYRMSWAATYAPVKVKFWDASTAELGELVSSQDEWASRTARRVLQERVGAEGHHGEEERRRLGAYLTGDGSAHRAIRSLWLQHLVGVGSSHWLEHGDENVRAWAVRLSADEQALKPEQALRIAATDPSAMVRLAIASALPSFADEARWQLAEALAARDEDALDAFLPKLIWYGIAPLADKDPMRAVALAKETPMPMLADSVTWYLSRDLIGREILAAWLGEASDATAKRILHLMAFSLPASGKLPAPHNWAALSKDLRRADTAPALDKLGGLFGDEGVAAAMRRTLADPSAPAKARQEAFDFLKASGDSDCAAELIAVLGESAFRSQVLPLMGRFDDSRVAAALLALLPGLEGDDRNAAVGSLSSKPKLAAALLAEIKSGRAQKSLLTSLHIRQMQGLGDEALTRLIPEVWGKLNESSADSRASIVKFRKLYTEAPRWSFDREAGAAVFAKTCATCHTKDGVGKLLGPDLTGSHGSGLDYFLENIVDPNAVVGENFQLNIITKNDGSAISGMPVGETADSLTIQTLTEATTVAKSQIKSRQVLEQSMMPAGLLDTLSDKEFIGLLKYLTTPSPAE